MNNKGFFGNVRQGFAAGIGSLLAYGAVIVVIYFADRGSASAESASGSGQFSTQMVSSQSLAASDGGSCTGSWGAGA